MQSGEETGQTERDYYVMQSEEEAIFVSEETGTGFKILGVQFYDREPIQLKAEAEIDETGVTVNIYLCQENGTDELLLSGMPGNYQQGNWFLSDTGEFYILTTGKIIKLDERGEELYHSHTEYSVRDICQLKNGRIILLVYDKEERISRLAELDAASGKISVFFHIALKDEYAQYISRGEDGLNVLNSDGIWEIDLKSGEKTCILSLSEVSYPMDSGICDFAITETRDIELLKNKMKKKLQLVNLADTKTIIVVRNDQFDESFENIVAQFNKENDTCFVVLEDCGEEMPDTAELVAMRERTNVEIATGVGPDIVFGEIVTNKSDLINKGAFVDLSIYMETSGIKEDDFFSFAFDSWRDGEHIYAVQMCVQAIDSKMAMDLVEKEENITINVLVDRLKKYPEKAIFNTYWDADDVLNFFLCGTEDLWGMIDWESGNCDFEGKLFEDMLKLAKQYGVTDSNEYQALHAFRYNYGLYDFETHEELESEGMCEVGYLFDDGCYAGIRDSNAMMINSNSPNKEAAWEFICYLLSEEVQEMLGWRSDYPVNRNAFDAIVEKEIEEGAYVVYETADGFSGVTYKGGGLGAFRDLGHDIEAYCNLYNLTWEKATEIKTRLEQARAFPVNTAEILPIVREEAAAYFGGNKSIEEVVKIIENRVQLYLDERG